MLRDQIEVLRDGMRRRGTLEVLAPTIERAERLDLDRRTLIQAGDERKAARNANAQEVARRKKAGTSADELISAGRALGDEIARLENDLRGVEDSLQGILLEIPNVTLAAVPSGGEEHNVISRTWGTPRTGKCAPHWEIGARLGIIDFERSSKISGSGFIVSRGLGARMIRSLLNLFMDTHAREHGYQEVWPPQLVTRQTMTGTGQLPKFEEDAYATSNNGLFLIPTAEVPVTNLYRDEIIDGGQLPMGFVAYSRCYRREAGSAGKDTRGVLRTHEFDKVELVRYCTPGNAAAELGALT